MRWIADWHSVRRRRKHFSVPRTIETLETRALLADGITAAGAAPISAVAGVPIKSAVFATYTVTDPSMGPGTQWRALINFGDGQSDGPVIPVEKGSDFEFVDAHTYVTPGTYTVTIMIALPGSHKPNDNTVMTQVTVASPSSKPTPNPNPLPTPTTPVLVASGFHLSAKANKTFHGRVAIFKGTGAKDPKPQAVIDWGDQTLNTQGRIRSQGKGRFEVLGSHRYAQRGVFHVTVTIGNGAGQGAATDSLIRVVK
jgi:hypothetical protein